MGIVGVVRLWHATEGWGVLDSDETPGGCWVHWSALRVASPRHLEDGHAVEFEWEHVTDQDGYTFRATAAWPHGREPVDPAVSPPGPSAAFWSTVTIDGLHPDDRPPDDPGRRRRR